MGRRASAGEPSQPVPDTIEMGPPTQSQGRPPYLGLALPLPLSTEAVKEFNRTDRERPRPPPLISAAAAARRLVRLAKRGGPDLSDIRGYSNPTLHCPPQDMKVSRTNNVEHHDLYSDPVINKSTAVYNAKFDQKLDLYGVNSPTWESADIDLVSITAALAVERPSFSLSTFSEREFAKFRRKLGAARDEDEVKACIIPALMGDYPNEHFALNTAFVGLNPLIDDTLPIAKPDLYCGLFPPTTLDFSVLQALAGHIEPSANGKKPIVPNFFLEIKGPDGSGRVLRSQARYDGVLGARAIHSLQNYGKAVPEYDHQPHTYSSTYHETGLKIYAHHLKKTDQKQPLQYHMTQVWSSDLTQSRQSFIDGVTAFRNARDLARKHRDVFVAAANARNLGLQELSNHQQRHDLVSEPPRIISISSNGSLTRNQREQGSRQGQETTIVVDTPAAKTTPGFYARTCSSYHEDIETSEGIAGRIVSELYEENTDRRSLLMS